MKLAEMKSESKEPRVKMDRRKEGMTITLSALIAWIPVVPVFWLVLQPLLVNAVTEAMSDELQRKVQVEVAPLNQAFIVLIQKSVADLRREIAALEYRRDKGNNWTSEDAKALVDLELELESSQEALAVLKAKRKN